MTMTPEKWQRYIDDQCTEQEKKEILHYLQGIDQETLKKALVAEDAAGQPAMPPALMRRMDNYVNTLTGPAAAPAKRAVYHFSYWAAASIIAICIGVWLFRKPATQQQQAGKDQYEMLQNNTDHVQKITLPDKSQAWLTPHTVLKIAANYNTRDREILLEGEAYFEVVHNAVRPFIVKTDRVQTTVLGTHFNIEAYGKEADTRVSLTEGKVAVKVTRYKAADSTVVLTPGKQLIYGWGTNHMRTETLAGGNEANWKTGALVLNDLSVPAVFSRLELRFGKKIQYRPEQFAGKKFTATYYQTNINTILQNIAFVQGFSFETKADTIFIQPSK